MANPRKSRPNRRLRNLGSQQQQPIHTGRRGVHARMTPHPMRQINPGRPTPLVPGGERVHSRRRRPRRVGFRKKPSDTDDIQAAASNPYGTVRPPFGTSKGCESTSTLRLGYGSARGKRSDEFSSNVLRESEEDGVLGTVEPLERKPRLSVGIRLIVPRYRCWR